jgi:hypothetical protein
MALLNYTTTVDAIRTAGQIEEILVKHGAKSVLKNYDNNRQLESISFLITTSQGEIGVRLPVRPEAVLRIMTNEYNSSARRRTYPQKDQAVRVAWRIAKDWIEAQMAIVETEMVTMDQVLLPYIETSSGKTVYQIFKERQPVLLGYPDNPKEMIQ